MMHMIWTEKNTWAIVMIIFNCDIHTRCSVFLIKMNCDHVSRNTTPQHFDFPVNYLTNGSQFRLLSKIEYRPERPRNKRSLTHFMDLDKSLHCWNYRTHKKWANIKFVSEFFFIFSKSFSLIALKLIADFKVNICLRPNKWTMINMHLLITNTSLPYQTSHSLYTLHTNYQRSCYQCSNWLSFRRNCLLMIR